MANETTEKKSYWWIAINGAAVPACLMAPMPEPKVVPTPQVLLGFPTRQEAAAAQRFFLTAPIKDCGKRLADLHLRKDVCCRTFANPGRIVPGADTAWLAGDWG